MSHPRPADAISRPEATVFNLQNNNLDLTELARRDFEVGWHIFLHVLG